MRLPLCALLVLVTILGGQAAEWKESQFEWFAVGGAVKKPDVYPINKDTNIAEAIKIGGGAFDGDGMKTGLANLHHVTVQRMKEGRQYSIDLDLEKNPEDRRFRIQAGDIISVPLYF